MNVSVEKVLASGEEVQFKVREWDGIDRPDFTTVRLGPARARSFAAELCAAASLAEENKVRNAQSRREELRRKRDEIAEQLAALDAELGNAN